jgi:alcohol dehydrogenase class IV
MIIEFTAPARIVFGEGVVGQAGRAAAEYSKRALVVTGMGGAAPDRIWESLQAEGVHWLQVMVRGEPDIRFIEECLREVRGFNPGVVIGYGGGSVMDTAKALSAILTNPGELLDYLEVVGKGQALVNAALPCIAIPTTAGTGSEVTRNAVIGVPDRHMKVSMRSPLMLPKVALVDPEVTYSLPPAVTATTGMDAITQVLEPYVSAKANRMTDLFCQDGLKNGPQALLHAYQNGENREARSKMAWTSLMGGLALANAGLGAVHGFASPIGGMYDAPHGAVCARLLAPVMKANIQALQKRDPTSPILKRYKDAACWMTGNENAGLEDGITWLEELSAQLAIPPLSTYGLNEEAIGSIVEKAAIASSMKANPIQLTDEELSNILRAAL